MSDPSAELSLQELRTALEALSPRLAVTAETILTRAVERLRAGLPADVGALVDGQTVSAELLRLRAAASQHGLSLPEDPDLATLRSGMERMLVEHSKNEIWQPAILLLDLILVIRHSSGEIPATLQRIQDSARTLRESLDSAVILDANSVSNKLRPFAALVSLVREDLPSDEKIEEAITIITETFGPQIITGLMTKRLTLSVPAVASQNPPTVKAAGESDALQRIVPAVPEAVVVSTTARVPIVLAKPATADDSPTTPPQSPSPASGPVGGLGDGNAPQPKNDTHPEVPSDDQLCAILWQLVADDRAGLASHIAALAGDADRIEAASLGGLFRLVALAPHACGSVALAEHAVQSQTEAINAYRDAVSDSVLAVRDNDIDEDERLARRILAFAASLRPALLAPQSGVSGLLASLDHLEADSEHFRAIRDALVTFSGWQLELDPMVLKGVRDHANWEQRLATHEKDCGEWLTSKRTSRLRFEAATVVWQDWVAETGTMGKVMRTVVAGKHDAGTQAQIVDSIKDWSRTQRIEQLIDSTDAAHRRQRSRLSPIEGPPRTEIHNRVQSFVALLQHWTQLLKDEPGKLNNFTEREVDSLRDAVTPAVSKAKADLGRVIERHRHSPRVIAAHRILNRALDDLGNLLDIASNEPRSVQPLRRILNQEFLQDSTLALDEHWVPKATASHDTSTERSTELLQRLLGIASQPADLHTAFERACTTRNHLRTHQIIEAFREDGHEPLALTLDARREAQLDACRAWMRERQNETLTRIERAVSHGLLTPEDRSDMQAKASKSTAETLDFSEVDSTLRSIDERLADLENGRAATVKAEYHQLLAERGNDLRDDDRGFIESALARHDFQSVWECLEFIRKGRPLQVTNEADSSAFDDFFVGQDGHDGSSFIARYAALLKNYRPRDVVEAIRDARPLPPIDLSGASADERKAAARLASAWLELKDNQDNPTRLKVSLYDLLLGLGFKDVTVGEIEIDAVDNCWRADIVTSPVRDRSICVVPHFGSQAEGRYKILGIHDSLNDDRLEEQTRNYRDSDAVVAFYFGLLNDRTRRALASRNWRESKCTIVLDDAVVFFACGSRTNRLARVFQCSLPFAFAEPYKTTASLVPVEMFFGRNRERASLIDPSGANLVYGGRQLGKSALLRDIERRENRPDQGRIVKWIDLKAAGVTKAEDIWTEIAHALVPLDIVRRNTSRRESIVANIQEWLHADHNRTILLLLDEADAFLVADGRKTDEHTHEGFPEVARLKGLMDKTNRRFKVVFAGLHNVQRTARDVNSPIAHLGNAVCIGPLLDDDEWKQARDLITVPLSRLGFVLDPPDLWMRIVSYTNYYPSLIQVFCKHLLEYLHRKEFDVTTSPPYQVTIDDIEKAYQLDSLQDEIRHKFEMTLDLDRRYRLIALRIALACLESDSTRYVGVDVDWVRGEGLSLWHQGFPQGEQSHELFRTLLYEMVGLGILRAIANDHYTIRSPNVLTLLGQKDKIVSDILDIADKPPAATYFNGMSRRPLNNDVWVRSPLTADQESFLAEMKNGCVILHGGELGGVSRLRQAFNAIPGVIEAVWGERMTQAAQFQSWLTERLTARPNKSEGVELIVVSEDCDWTSQWVEIAVRTMQTKTGVKRVSRIVFIAGPDRTWSLTDDTVIDGLDVSRCSLTRWHPTFFDYWAQQVGLPLTTSLQHQLRDATGGWPLLMEAFAEKCRDSTHLWEKHLLEVFCGLGTIHSAEALLTPAEARKCMSAIAEHQPLAAADADALRADHGNGMQRTLRWAERLEFTDNEASGLVVEPIIREILAASTPA